MAEKLYRLAMTEAKSGLGEGTLEIKRVTPATGGWYTEWRWVGAPFRTTRGTVSGPNWGEKLWPWTYMTLFKGPFDPGDLLGGFTVWRWKVPQNISMDPLFKTDEIIMLRLATSSDKRLLIGRLIAVVES